ncbi:MAG: hypothetical protein V4485_06235 [Pseudomonadota bacterium]
MQDNTYEELKQDIRQIFSLIDNLAEMNAANEYGIKTTRIHLHNVLRIMYSLQDKVDISQS